MKSKVYVLPDDHGRILRCEGGYTMDNITDPDNWVLIDEGHGDRYNLCQSHYFHGGLYTEDSIPKYKLLGEKPILRTDEEIEADRIPASDPSLSLEDRVGTLEIDSAETKEALEMILSGVTE